MRAAISFGLKKHKVSPMLASSYVTRVATTVGISVHTFSTYDTGFFIFLSLCFTCYVLFWFMVGYHQLSVLKELSSLLHMWCTLLPADYNANPITILNKYTLASKCSKNDARRRTHIYSLYINQFSPTFSFPLPFQQLVFTIFALSVGCQHKHCQYL